MKTNKEQRDGTSKCSFITKTT